MSYRSGQYSEYPQHHPHNHEHSHEHDHDPEDHHDHDEGWLEWARVAFVAVILVLVWAQVVPRMRGIDILALIGVLIGGYPIFKEAIADLLERRMTMELSMTIALVAASVIGEFFTALLITVFVIQQAAMPAHAAEAEAEAEAALAEFA